MTAFFLAVGQEEKLLLRLMTNSCMLYPMHRKTLGLLSYNRSLLVQQTKQVLPKCKESKSICLSAGGAVYAA